MTKLSIAVITGLMMTLGATAQAADGKATYDAKCASCHATGAAGAPKLGDKEAWAARIAAGNDAMMASVMNGKNAMPPKGACADCSDDDLKASMEYMVSESK